MSAELNYYYAMIAITWPSKAVRNAVEEFDRYLPI